ncbi:MAG TPA: ROK family protein [Solirubrobacteraceae bacterium]|nr:ROK family protein [Solirubrobacteraceae bacterium]
MDGAAMPAFVLGIDFGGTKVAFGTADPGGRLLASARIENDGRPADAVVAHALRAAAALAARTAADTGGRLAAAGAVSPGVVGEDGIRLAPNVAGWEDLRLPALVRDALGLGAVAFGNDVKAAALAEARWGALRGADPAVFINLGTGLAAGIVAGGHVLAGAHGAAGEIGYSLRGTGDAAGAAHGRAPLEEAVAGRGIGERASALLGGAWTAADAFASDDPAAAGLVDDALAELAVHIANLAIALDPARIALGGGLMRDAARILPVLRARLDLAVPFPPELVPAAFVDDGALRGAVALALEPQNQRIKEEVP